MSKRFFWVLIAVPLILVAIFKVIDLCYDEQALHTNHWATLWTGVLSYYGTILLGYLTYSQTSKKQKIEMLKIKSDVAPQFIVEEIGGNYPGEIVKVNSAPEIERKNNYSRNYFTASFSQPINQFSINLIIKNDSSNKAKNFQGAQTDRLSTSFSNANYSPVLRNEVKPQETIRLDFFVDRSKLLLAHDINVFTIETYVSYQDILENEYVIDYKISGHYWSQDNKLEIDLFYSDAYESNNTNQRQALKFIDEISLLKKTGEENTKPMK